MPLVHMKDMLNHAHRQGYAVGAFDLVSLDFLEAIMAGAEACRAPVILSLAESHFDHYDFELATAATAAAARRAKVPVAIHLDQGAGPESAVKGIRLGCTGVMADVSTLPFADKLRVTREVVDTAHACGVPVEGLLGPVAGEEEGDAAHTLPEEAAKFVAETGVDFLAVSIGAGHGHMGDQAKTDLERLEAIRRSVDLPLATHGGAGLNNQQLRALIERGVAKINYGTALADVAASMAANFQAVEGYARLMARVRGAVRAKVERCIRRWGGEGRAEEILANCRPWREVEHLIVYNLTEEAEDRAEELKAIGHDVLARVPGVRRVASGRAWQEDARYRHCWLIRFSGAETIASYMAHPDHVDYADRHFRPHAGDRIKIDYVLG